MASQYATGAVHVFVTANPGSPAPVYFGTCERMPEDTRQPAYEMLFNDISGTQKPLDIAFQGEDATISLVMTRWSEAVAISLETKPALGAGQAARVPGSWLWEDVGTLMGLENAARQVWLVNTFTALANKPAYTANPAGPLFGGRRYLQCAVWAPESEEKGTAPMKRHFMLYAWPKVDSANRRFTLYDFNMTGINPSMIT